MVNGQQDKIQNEVRKITGLSEQSNKIIPIWFIIHVLINVSSGEILLPHDSAGWSKLEYIKWFNEHSDIDRFKFYKNLINSYQQSVIAKGGIEYAKFYPLINEVIDNFLTKIK